MSKVKPIRMDITLQVGTEPDDTEDAFTTAERYVSQMLSKTQIATFSFIDQTAHRLSNNWCSTEWEVYLQVGFEEE